MNRRGFLRSILAAGVAPYVMSNGVASGVLMPVRRIWTPQDITVTLDEYARSFAPGNLMFLAADGRVLGAGKCPLMVGPLGDFQPVPDHPTRIDVHNSGHLDRVRLVYGETELDLETNMEGIKLFEQSYFHMKTK